MILTANRPSTNSAKHSLSRENKRVANGICTSSFPMHNAKRLSAHHSCDRLRRFVLVRISGVGHVLEGRHVDWIPIETMSSAFEAVLGARLLTSLVRSWIWFSAPRRSPPRMHRTVDRRDAMVPQTIVSLGRSVAGGLAAICYHCGRARYFEPRINANVR